MSSFPTPCFQAMICIVVPTTDFALFTCRGGEVRVVVVWWWVCEGSVEVGI